MVMVVEDKRLKKKEKSIWFVYVIAIMFHNYLLKKSFGFV
jgi:hypothetical protein